MQKRAYYLRFRVNDRPGIIATLAGILAEKHISLEAVLQQPCETKHDLPFVITVEPTTEAVGPRGSAADGVARFSEGAAAGAADGAAVMRKLVCSFLLVCFGSVTGQAAKKANERYQTPEGRKARRQKAGRRRSRRAAEAAANWSRRCGLRAGMTVADIGTGVGYMLPFLSQAVGPQGRVLAEDIFDDFLAQAKTRVADAKLANVTFVKGTEHGPQLPEDSVDVALALDSYHHYDYPADMLAGIHKALKPGGRLVIVEYYKTQGRHAGRQRAPAHPSRQSRLDQRG